MKQIVTEVLQAEESVNARLQEAREQAARIKAAAEKDVAAKMAETQDMARLIVQEAIDEAKAEAERLRNGRLEAADREKDNLMTGQADVIDRLVEQICETILATEEE
jgi:vacuolar-type H+-ATPase subunit H